MAPLKRYFPTQNSGPSNSLMLEAFTPQKFTLVLLLVQK